MKINGAGQPPVPEGEGAKNEATKNEATSIGGLEKPGASGASDPATGAGKAFAETLAGPGAVRTPQVESGDPTVRALAADVDAGRLDARAAVDKLIDHVIDLQLGGGASPQAREQVAAALREAVASDPLIAEKLKSLG